MARILLIEDTHAFHQIVTAALRPHEIKIAETAEEGTALIRTEQYDLLLLDISLPGRDGYSVLQELQTLSSKVELPVICLTSKSQIGDKVTAFSLGADDYLIKPFDPLELKARVEAKLRKPRVQTVRTIGDLEIDHNKHRAYIVENEGRTELALTLIEFKLLSLLTQEPERIYSRAQLLEACWTNQTHVLERAVDVHISALRKKLGPLGKSLKAVTGVGYKFVTASAKRQAS